MTEEFTSAIKAEFEKYFKDAGIFFSCDIIKPNEFFVTLTLAKNENECVNSILRHDDLYSIFAIEKINTKEFQLTCTNALELRIKKCSVFEYVQIPFRKTTGDQKKIVSYLGDKVFKRVAETVINNKDYLITKPIDPLDKIRK